MATTVAPEPQQQADPNQPGTLAYARTPDYPDLTADNRKKADYVQRLINDGQFDAIGRYKLATQHLLFIDGRQHIDWALREKVWMDAPNVDQKVRVTYNYIRPILRARMQRLLSPSMAWRATPKSNDYEERDRATVGSNLLQDRWRKCDLDGKTRAALWLAFGCGAAWLKSFWNPKIGSLRPATVMAPHPATGAMTEYPVDENGNLLADQQGNPEEEGAFRYRPGDVDTAVRSIFNIRINRDAMGLDVAEGFRWLVDTEVVPISVVKEKYGAAAKNVSTVAGITTIRNYEAIVRSITAPYGTVTGNDLLTGRDGGRIPDRELTLLSEYWEAPSEALPNGRLLVIAGNELIYPQDPEQDRLGLPQGLVPYTALYDERRPYDPYGRAMCRDLVSPQKVINTQWGLAIQEQALSGIGQWVGFDVPGVFDQITNTAGGHIKVPLHSAVMNKSLEEIIHKVGPVNVSADRWRMIDESLKAMFDIGSFHEIQRGQVPPGVDSGIAVQLLQESEAGQLADSVQDLKKSFIQWGRQQLAIAKWGYDGDEERWLPVHRPDLDFMIESITGDDLPDPDDIDIDLEGFKPQSQAAMRADIKDFTEKGWMTPQKGLALMDLGRGVEGAFASQTRHYAKARKENLNFEKGLIQLQAGPPSIGPDGQPTGQPQVVFTNADGSDVFLPADDDHAIHIDVHEEIILDDAKPWKIRQMLIEHVEDHRQAMTPPNTLMQPAPGGPPPAGAGGAPPPAGHGAPPPVPAPASAPPPPEVMPPVPPSGPVPGPVAPGAPVLPPGAPPNPEVLALIDQLGQERQAGLAHGALQLEHTKAALADEAHKREVAANVEAERIRAQAAVEAVKTTPPPSAPAKNVKLRLTKNPKEKGAIHVEIDRGEGTPQSGSPRIVHVEIDRREG